MNCRHWVWFITAAEFRAFLVHYGLSEHDVVNKRALEVLGQGTAIKYSEYPLRGERNPKIRYTPPDEEVQP